MSRDDFDIPDLGPAEPDRVAPSQSNTANKAAVASDIQPPPVKRSGGWFQSFLLILLVSACSGLGYWGLTMYEQLQTERASVAELQTQMKEMRGLLNLAETSAQKSGDTLLDQVTRMSKAAQDKYQHFDSEVAKLWAIAYQKNKPELEKQAKQLTAQSSQLNAQKTQLKAQTTKLSEQTQLIAAQTKALDAAKQSLAAQQKKISAISAELNKSQSSVKSRVAADLKKIRAEVAAAQTGMRLSEEAMTEEQATLTTSIRTLTDRTAVLESGQRKNGLERRVKNNEDAVRAYDATRRELNRSLLQIKKKINALQLVVETQVK